MSAARSKLVRVDLEQLMQGDTQLEELWEFDQNAPLNFTHSPDGRHLYGTSYYTGTSNVFRYDFDTKTMNAVSNTETGFFRPIAAGSATRSSSTSTPATGMRPVMHRRRHPRGHRRGPLPGQRHRRELSRRSTTGNWARP